MNPQETMMTTDTLSPIEKELLEEAAEFRRDTDAEQQRVNNLISNEEALKLFSAADHFNKIVTREGFAELTDKDHEKYRFNPGVPSVKKECKIIEQFTFGDVTREFLEQTVVPTLANSISYRRKVSEAFDEMLNENLNANPAFMYTKDPVVVLDRHFVRIASGMDPTTFEVVQTVVIKFYFEVYITA